MARHLDSTKNYHTITDPPPSTWPDEYQVAEFLFWWDDAKEWVLDRLSEALDVLSLVADVFSFGTLGGIFDLMNAGISYARGNYGEAALDLAAAVPFVGLAATGAKYLGKATQAVAKASKHVGNVASMTKMTKGIGNTVKTGGKTMGTGAQVAKRSGDAGSAAKRSNAAKKNTQPDSCPDPKNNQCFVGDTKVLIFAEVPEEIIANWTPVRLDPDQARSRNVLGMWFTVSALGVVVAIGLRSVRRRDEEDAADHTPALAPNAVAGTEESQDRDDSPIQPLISPAQFRIVPLYEGPTENTVPNTEPNTEPQAGQFIRKSLLLSDLFGKTYNPPVGPSEACPVVLAHDADETTTRSRFRTLLDWPHWTSAMWASLLLCLGTCIGFAWYDSPSNTATMPAGEIGAVNAVGSRPDVEGWSGFESALLDINQIRVGMRVAAENPEVSDTERRTFVDPDPATWRFLKLRLPKSADPQDFVEIEMLRPAAWLEQHTTEVGGRVLLDLQELGAKGWAEVLEIGPCPEIFPGPGSVVTATFAHQPTSEILDVTIKAADGSEETIGVTANHPFWSVDHQAFIPVGHLEPGTRVKTHLDQIQTIVNLLPHPGHAERVYNLEVHGEHVYYVGSDNVLVHNVDPNKPLSCGPRVTKAGEEIRNIKLTGWSKGREAGHFAKHAADMGITSQRAYTEAAKALAKKTTNVVEAKVGNTLFKYDKTTQNILIINGGNRKIKTFYKADNGIESFKDAMRAHWEVLKRQGHTP